ncbi:MAG: enoyl-CoA hydratase/isomerase family protein [Thermomicrobia bacterium]|nr:enoyl-CoA hydratase/isomerase family protein [Thermomicrobia bacterium]
MAYETLLAETVDGVLTLTLNRPDVLNAVTDTMLRELQDALRGAERDAAVRCIVLTGAGRGFCAGQDISGVAEPQPHDGERPSIGDHLRGGYNPIVRRIRAIEKPVIAAVNGVAAGAGANLALACDLRIASAEASFVQAFVKIGLVPDSGGTLFLPLLVGYAKAAELAFTGDRIRAEESLRLGLVNQVVPVAALMETTHALAARLAALPTRAIGLTKRAFNRAMMPDLDAVLDYEADMQEIAGRTQDYREGVAAFREKRPPSFTGQ